MTQNTHSKTPNTNTLKTILKHNGTLFILAAIVAGIIMHISINAFYNKNQYNSQSLHFIIGEPINVNDPEKQLEYLGLDRLSHRELKKRGFICSDLDKEECLKLLRKIYGFNDDGVSFAESEKDKYFRIHHTSVGNPGGFDFRYDIKNMPNGLVHKWIDCDIVKKQCNEIGKYLNVVLLQRPVAVETYVQTGPAPIIQTDKGYVVEYGLENLKDTYTYNITSNKDNILDLVNVSPFECGKHFYRVDLNSKSFKYHYDDDYSCRVESSKP